jgi:hypothetical protein
MLNQSEKAYCLALQSLRDKKYGQACDYFGRAAAFFKDNKEFNLFHESTRLLVAVKEELAAADGPELVIEEDYSNGQR